MNIEQKREFLRKFARRQALASRDRVIALRAQVAKASTYAQSWELRADRAATMDEVELEMFVADIQNMATMDMADAAARNSERELTKWIVSELSGEKVA